MELSIVLIVVGMMAGMALKYSTTQVNEKNVYAVNERMERVEAALIDYRKAHNRLPCPAIPTLKPSDAGFGVEAGTPGDGNCDGAMALGSPSTNSVMGAVPVKTLGLPDEAMYDTWKRQFSYLVDKRITATDAFLTYPITDTIIGDIVVKDATFNNRTVKGVSALISHGPNGHGGYMPSGVRYDGDSTNSDEQENCACDADGLTAGSKNNNIIVQKATLLNSATPTDSFDDIVRYKLRWHYKGEADLAVDEEEEEDSVEFSFASSPDSIERFSLDVATDTISAPLVTPAGACANGSNKRVTYSPDNTYIACAGNADAPGDNSTLAIFKRSGVSAILLDSSTNISPPPTNLRAEAVAFSPDNRFLAVGNTTLGPAPYLRVYERTNDNFTKLDDGNFSSLPANSVKSAAFSTDGVYLAIGTLTDPKIDIYKRKDKTFSKLAFADSYFTGFTINHMEFDTTSTYLCAVGGLGVAVYKRNSDTYTRIFNFNVPGGANDCRWSPDSNFLAFTRDVGAFTRIYQRSGDSFVYTGTPTSSFGSDASFDFSPDSNYIVAVNVNAPPNNARLLKRSGSGYNLVTTFSASTNNNKLMEFSHGESNLARISSVDPPADGIYTTGQNLDFTVNFNKPVTITNSPVIDILIGSVWEQATYLSGSGTTRLIFRYTVKAGDTDNNGIGVYDPINRNGNGRIENANVTAQLFFNSPDTSGIIISTLGPQITSVTVPADATYVAGQTLQFDVTYDADVDVLNGTPRLQLDIGGVTRYANYVSNVAPNVLRFQYLIVGGDLDADGIGVTSPINQNGGRIEHATTQVEADYNFTGVLPPTTGILVGSNVPLITAVNPPPDGIYLHNQNLVFSFTFSQVVNVTGTPRLQLTIGSLTRYANYVSGTGTNVLTFRYLLSQTTDEEDLDGITMFSPLQLNGGTIKNAGMIDANLNFTVPDTSGVLVDFDAVYSGTDLLISTTDAAGRYVGNYDIDYTTDTLTSITPSVDTVGVTSNNVVSFSQDNVYAVSGLGFINNGNKLMIWKRTGTTFNKLADPAFVPNGANEEIYDAKFSPDTNYLAVGSATIDGDVLTIYKRSGDTFTRLDPNTNVVPPMDTSRAIYTVAWSSDSTYLVAGRFNTSPALHVYKRSGDTFTQLTDPPSLPGFGVNECDWSHNNAYLACAANWQGLINIWKRSGDSFTVNSSTPAIDYHGYAAAFSHDSTYLAVGMSNTPYLRIFKRSGDSYTALAGVPATVPPNAVQAVAWNHDSSYLYVGVPGNANYGYIYKRSGDSFTPIAFTNPVGSRKSDFRKSNGYVAPVITDFSIPANGIYYTGQNLDFGVTFDKNVDVSGTPRISININGATRYATYTSGSGTKILTFRYGVVAADKDYDGITFGTAVEENGGGIQDSSNGVNADMTLVYMDGAGILINAQYEIAVASNNTPFVTMYDLDRTTDTLIKMPNLTGGLPPNQTFGVHYSPDNTYLATISGNAPRLQIYKMTNGYYTKLADPAVLPNNQGNFAKFSKTNTYLAVGFVGANGFYMYKRSGDTFTQIAFPALPGTRSAVGGNWSSDDTYFALGMTDQAGNNDLAIYKRSGDTFTELGTPAYVPAGGQQFNNATFSNDDTYLIMPLNWNGVVMFKRSGDTFTQIASPPSLPSVFCSQGAWSSDATYLAISCWSNSPYMAIYKRSGDTFNKLADPATVPTGNGTSATFSPDDAYLAISSQSSPYVLVYKRSGDTFTKIADPATLPTGQGQSVAWRNTVSSTTISSVTPPANGSYSGGQNMDFTVNFTEAVTVTGTPRIALTIGSTTRYATYVSGTGTSSLLFRHTVQVGDQDLNGIAMFSPVELNGGTIKNGVAADAMLTYTPPNTAGVLVDASNPSILSITPPSDNWYVASQNMNFAVSFTENVVVTGTPRIQLTIGATTRYATYISGTGTSVLYFRYIPVTGDIDTNGIDIVSPLELNGGTIKDVTNNNAVLTFVPPATPNVKVDAVLATITSVTPPANGGYGLNAFVDFVVNYDEAINVTGTPRIALTVGSSTRYANYFSGTGTANLTFRYVVMSGDYDINGIQNTSPVDLNSGTLRDLAGNDALLAFTPPNTASVNIDAPTMVELATGVYDIGAGGSHTFNMYTIDWTNDVLNSVASPTGVPVGGTTNYPWGLDWSHDSVYLASGQFSNNNELVIYKRTGTALTKLVEPATAPLATQTRTSFTNDSKYLGSLSVLADGNATSRLRLFKRNGDVFTELPTPALPTIQAAFWNKMGGGVFSPDGTLFATTIVGLNYKKSFHIYRRSGDRLVLASTIDVPGTDLPNGAMAFSPDNNYFAYGSYAAPFLYIYKRKGNKFYRIMPDVAPVGAITDLKFSPDSAHLVYSNNTAPRLHVYKRTGDNFNAIGSITGGTNGLVSYSADGTYLFASSGATVNVYERSGDNYSDIADPATQPINTITAFASRQKFVTLTKPEDGNYATGQNLDFTVNFYENVYVTGNPRLVLTVGAATQYAAYLSGDGSSSLTFRYTAQGGDVDSDGITVNSTVDLNGGTIRNIATTNMPLVFPAVDTRTVKINPTAAYNLSALNGTDGFRVTGEDYSEFLGWRSSAGDINGDGYQDIVISAYWWPSGSSNGTVYVIFGKASGWVANLNPGTLDGTNGFRINGLAAGDRLGQSVVANGDVNGDGIADLVIGAMRADPGGVSQAGSTYVIFGKTSAWGASFDLSTLNGTNGFRLDGTAMNDFSGSSVAYAGDVNADGYDDIMVGAEGANGVRGYTYVIFGKTGAWAAATALSSLNGTTGFRLDGVAAGDTSSNSISSGDVNNDGYSDLIVGAFQADPGGNSGAGSTYVVFGKSAGWAATIDLSTLDGTTGTRFDGVAANDQSAIYVGSGDVNGDGYADILIGAVGADPGGINIAGSTYIVFGKAAGWAASTSLSTLDGTTGARLDGIAALDGAASVPQHAGDFNGDGYADILIGSSGGDGEDSDSGLVYIIYGKPTGWAATATINPNGILGAKYNGMNDSDNTGEFSSFAGDVNGDGIDDIIIGARSADFGNDIGYAYVVFGK